MACEKGLWLTSDSKKLLLDQVRNPIASTELSNSAGTSFSEGTDPPVMHSFRYTLPSKYRYEEAASQKERMEFHVSD